MMLPMNSPPLVAVGYSTQFMFYSRMRAVGLVGGGGGGYEVLDGGWGWGVGPGGRADGGWELNVGVEAGKGVRAGRVAVEG